MSMALALETPAAVGEPLALRVHTSFDGLEPIAGAWNELALGLPRPSPYLLFPWARTWWREYSSRGELAVVVASRGGTTAGILPAFVRRSRGMRVLRFLGDYRSMLADVLLAPGEDARLARRLLEAALAGADYASLFGLSAGSTAEAAAAGALRLHERNEAPVVELGSDWEAVLRSKLSSDTRARFRRKRRRLEELGRLEIDYAVTPARVARAAEESFRIHELRWQGRPDLSGIATAEAQRFYSAAYRALAEERPGTLRIATLRLEGRAIAYNAHFLLGRRMYAHRLGFDPAHGRFSPGLLLILDVFERACAEGVELVELLGPAEDYKRPFVDRFEPLHEGIGLPQTVRGRIAVGAHEGGIRARSRLKRHARLRQAYVSARAALGRFPVSGT